MPDTDQAYSEVFLAGDSDPIGCTLTVEQIAAHLADIPAAHMAHAFVGLPLPDGGRAFVRPLAIVAMFPAEQDT